MDSQEPNSAEVTSLQEYAFAKKMVHDIPLAVEELEKSMNSLYPYRGFISVTNILISIEGAILGLETRLPGFVETLKGKK